MRVWQKSILQKAYFQIETFEYASPKAANVLNRWWSERSERNQRIVEATTKAVPEGGERN